MIKVLEEDLIVWIDCEMTGLDLEKDHIVEIACIITDKDLNILDEAPDIVINYPEEIITSMNEWSWEHHSQSGLVDAIRESKTTLAEADTIISEFIGKHFLNKNSAILAGNSVHVDKRFLEKDFPKTYEYFHYRIIDVSTVKELTRRWYPEVFAKLPTFQNLHRALDDIKGSINELNYYRDIIFKHKLNPLTNEFIPNSEKVNNDKTTNSSTTTTNTTTTNTNIDTTKTTTSTNTNTDTNTTNNNNNNNSNINTNTNTNTTIATATSTVTTTNNNRNRNNYSPVNYNPVNYKYKNYNNNNYNNNNNKYTSYRKNDTTYFIHNNVNNNTNNNNNRSNNMNDTNYNINNTHYKGYHPKYINGSPKYNSNVNYINNNTNPNTNINNNNNTTTTINTFKNYLNKQAKPFIPKNMALFNSTTTSNVTTTINNTEAVKANPVVTTAN